MSKIYLSIRGKSANIEAGEMRLVLLINSARCCLTIIIIADEYQEAGIDSSSHLELFHSDFYRKTIFYYLFN